MTKMISKSLLVLLLALAIAAPAWTFIRISRQGPNGVVQAHWLDSELPLRSIVDPTNVDITADQAFAVVHRAAKTWEDVTTSYFTVDPIRYPAAGAVQPALAFDMQNSVLFEQTGSNFPTPGVIAFVRSFVNTTDGHTLDADMVFNDRDFFSSISDTGITPAPPGPPAQSSVDLQSVIAHEYGHYFGLDHTSISGSTMIPFIANNLSQRTLELDDRAGLSAIFPEPSFLTSTGSIRGTVLSGLTGGAVFGAHVEAYRAPGFGVATGISAISGELTLRNGRGEYEIRGLPPGDYIVRIVPLDGVQTTAADGNIGGVYNGLDINFEVEFWNGARESGIGFEDPPNDAELVAVTGGAVTDHIDFVTNGYPGRVILQPHGSFENTVTFTTNNQHLAVRFDLPFTPPYTIVNVQFPTVTFNGVPAVFPSVSLRRMNPATGLPDFAAAPLFSQAPFSGNPNGLNTVPINHQVQTADETLFWVIQFPPQPPTFPNNFPFIRMDFQLHERGYFGASYSINAAGTAGSMLLDRNLAASMTALLDPDDVPIEAPPAAFGMNRRVEFAEFAYRPPADVRADGFPMPQNSLAFANLLRRSLAVYGIAGMGGAGNPVIKVEPNPSSTTVALWGVQAVDTGGRRSLLSNLTLSGALAAGSDDADEPNGRSSEAKALTLPVANRAETYWPAGDDDYYSFTAPVGQVITATATSAPANNTNDLDLVMLLFDGAGKLVAFNDDSGTTLNPRISYLVTPPSANSNKNEEKFTLLVTDFYSSPFSPSSAARVVLPPTYTLNISSAPPPPPPPPAP